MEGRRLHSVKARAVAVDDFSSEGVTDSCLRFSGRRFSCSRCPGSFLTSRVILGEPLLSRLALPVIIANTPTVHDDSAAKLAKHRPSSDDCNLSGSIGEGEDVLIDEIFFLFLSCDDFEKRPVLVE